ncbi:MAG: GHKL domain-containing protein [Acetatifactor sp.]|nr:GHKL domain-containing protein [Acetatifactor sp.]
MWVLALELLLFFSLEGTLFSWQRGFEAQTERFQRDILSHQYEEIREIYLNMRSWRHDYHNHLQVMKAQLALGQVEEMRQYLDDLEQSLDGVDTYVKSGNLMTDAILNSKLTLAEQKKIRVSCKAVLPETLSVEDVDLCVLLGNLLDNALEACDKIPPEQRFLRIYMVVNRSQLYISVQNSAREDLDFDERNYISQKRGDHGLGMKRVKALTDKYEGYLTLANEPGIFAAELTLPLWEEGRVGE